MQPELAEQLPRIENLSDHAVLIHCLDLIRDGTSGRSSFELHTPLELMARYRLLPWVEGGFRHTARAQMLATALDFRRIAKPFPAALGPSVEWAGVSGDAPWRDIAAALRTSRPDDLQTVARQLGDRILANVGGAGHGHLLLAFAHEADGWVCERLVPHLRSFVEWFASDEETDGAALLEDLQPLAAAKRVEDVAGFLAAVPKNSAESEHGGIRGIVDRARQTGFDCQVDADPYARPLPRCVAALEAAAQFMLLEEDELEYGWSHCLTLPEAACTLAENATEGGAQLPTAVAISYVAAFVSALRSGAPLPPLADAGALSGEREGLAPRKKEPSAGEREGLAPRKKEPAATTRDLRDALMGNDALHAAPAVALRLSEAEATSAWTLICSLASVRPDAHLVKYTFACLRCANRSQHPPLFLAAAVKLLAAWLVRYPEGTKPADLLIDRLA